MPYVEKRKSFGSRSKSIALEVESSPGSPSPEIEKKERQEAMIDQPKKIKAEDIEARFEELLENTMMIPSEARAKLVKDLNLGQKWTFLAQQEKRARTDTLREKQGTLKSSPEYMVTQLITNPNANTYRALRVCIATEPVAWLEKFAEKSGVDLLVQSIMINEKMKDKTDEHVELIYEGVQCVIAMSNSGDGLEVILKACQGDMLKYLTWCLGNTLK